MTAEGGWPQNARLSGVFLNGGGARATRVRARVRARNDERKGQKESLPPERFFVCEREHVGACGGWVGARVGGDYVC